MASQINCVKFQLSDMLHTSKFKGTKYKLQINNILSTWP